MILVKVEELEHAVCVTHRLYFAVIEELTDLVSTYSRSGRVDTMWSMATQTLKMFCCGLMWPLNGPSLDTKQKPRMHMR